MVVNIFSTKIILNISFKVSSQWTILILNQLGYSVPCKKMRRNILPISFTKYNQFPDCDNIEKNQDTERWRESELTATLRT